MNWLEIIRLLVVLWPIIEKIISGIDGEDKKTTARAEAVAAFVEVVTTNKVA